MSKLSILGLYQHDQSLFDNLQLPAEFTTADRETLINNLLMECAEFECTYPAFDFCKAAIGFWSKARLPVWQKLYNTMSFVYNPIWNKDGKITETRTKEYSGEKAGTVESSKAAQMEKGDVHADLRSSSGDQSSTTEDQVAGFNSNTYVKKAKSTATGTWSESVTDTDRHTITGTDSETGSTTESGTSSGEESEDYTRIEQGNIGLTSTQQLIKEEREVVQFEIDEFIINDFKKQFCILVY